MEAKVVLEAEVDLDRLQMLHLEDIMVELVDHMVLEAQLE
jgi:hypothetical protein